MIFSIDHIVFAASGQQSQALRRRLALAGFSAERFHLEFPEIGAASDSLSYAGGGFVEFVVELEPERSPRVWFAEIPRVIGLGFGSDAFENDTPWAHDSGGWMMDEDHVLPDGSELNIHAAGPHAHLTNFYVFVMDRRERTLQFPEGRGPRLKRLAFVGRDASRWKENLARWLQLADDGVGLSVGGVELRFRLSALPSIRVSPTFDVTTGSGVVTLAQSSLELTAR